MPHQPGVYFVLFEAKTIRLAYLGRADDLCARWAGHHREPELRLLTELGLPVEIAWTHAEKSVLPDLEVMLIQALRPPLNEQQTLRLRRARLSSSSKPTMATATEILQDYRSRRDAALSELLEDDFWSACNSEDGDLLCLWPYPDEVVWVNVNELWMYSDTHPLTAFRVPCPPAIAANDGGFVAPKVGFEATSVERRRWTIDVAMKVDAWLAGVAHYLAAQVGPQVLRDVLQSLAQESTLVQLLEEAH